MAKVADGGGKNKKKTTTTAQKAVSIIDGALRKTAKIRADGNRGRNQGRKP